MRLFKITSPNWKGEVELVYNEAGKLVRMSFEGCEIERHEAVVEKFKMVVPVRVDTLEASFASTSAVVVEAGFSVSFDMFWDKYNLKLNRIRCEKLWDKMSKTDQVKAFYGVDAYDKFLKVEKWLSKANPDTYLRDKRWTDEYK